MKIWLIIMASALILIAGIAFHYGKYVGSLPAPPCLYKTQIKGYDRNFECGLVDELLEEHCNKVWCL